MIHFIHAEQHGGSYEEQMNCHREFMRTQDIASDFAEKFNEAILQALTYFSVEDQGMINKSLCRVEFIEPMVVDLVENGVKTNVLVEPMLSGEYKKFNR